MTTPPPPAGFTPGPWTFTVGRTCGAYGAFNDPAYFSINGAGHKEFATVVRLRADNTVHPNGEANARLIAASPDLYAACKAMYEAFLVDNDRMTPSQQEAARLMYAALAKANGGAQ